MPNTAAARTADEITADIATWEQNLQDPHIEAGWRARVNTRLATLRAELRLTDFEAIGRQAYLNDEHGAPALNAQVRAAIADLPVGGGAADIMRAFTRGYEAEREIELARILADG